MRKTWKVYGLIDPRDEEIRYIGCTTARYLSNRLNDHVQSARGHKTRQHGLLRTEWIRDVLASGKRPQILLLQTAFSEEEAKFLEQAWINRYADQIVNELGGGPGAPRPSQRLREEQSKRMRERWANMSDDEREKRNEHLRRIAKDSVAKAQTESQKVWRGKKHSVETRELLRQQRLGKKLPPHHVAALRGRKYSDEARKRISEAQRARRARERANREADDT